MFDIQTFLMHYTFGLNNSSQCLGRGQLTPSPKGENSANYQWDGSLKQVMDCSVPARKLCGMSVSIHTVCLLIMATLNSILSAPKNPESQGLGQWQDTGGHTQRCLALATTNMKCNVYTTYAVFPLDNHITAGGLCVCICASWHMCLLVWHGGMSRLCGLPVWVRLAETNLEGKSCVINSVGTKLHDLYLADKKSSGLVSQDPILVLQNLSFLEKDTVALRAALPPMMGRNNHTSWTSTVFLDALSFWEPVESRRSWHETYQALLKRQGTPAG